jgi:hypothetical protein
MTNRLHRCDAYGLETYACDGCYGYEPEAYGEPPAIYEDEGVEGATCEYCGGPLYQTKIRRFECEDCGRTKAPEYEY